MHSPARGHCRVGSTRTFVVARGLHPVAVMNETEPAGMMVTLFTDRARRLFVSDEGMGRGRWTVVGNSFRRLKMFIPSRHGDGLAGVFVTIITASLTHSWPIVTSVMMYPVKGIFIPLAAVRLNR